MISLPHRLNFLRRITASALAAALALPAAAQFTVPSDGSDGVLNVTSDRTIDLGLATTGEWNTPGNGNGVYDPNQWIVVFKYQSVNIAAGRTVRFINHPANPPVVWLVQGDVVINGTVNVSGGSYLDSAGVYPGGGPGGFRAARYPYDGVSSVSFGPGGSFTWGGMPNWNYGNASCFPLIGGSGGMAWEYFGARRAGGGGGAVLIASGTAISGSGGIHAKGGNGSDNEGGRGGCGGMIRLVAPSVSLANASATANGSSPWGRIRVEANQYSIASCAPAFSNAPLPENFIFLRHELTPSVRVVSVGGIAAPNDPRAAFSSAADVTVGNPQVEVVLECRNVPQNGSVKVFLRSATSVGGATVNATFQSGTTELSTWVATGNLGTGNQGFATVQARASLP